MSLYESDEKGEYRTTDKWVRAWGGGGAYIAGFTVCEIREYTDGTMRVHTGNTTYINQNPEMSFAHSVYLQAQKEMGI